MQWVKDFLFGPKGGATYADLDALVRRERFSDFLPYVAFDPKKACYHNSDGTVGHLWECTPLAFVGQKDIKTLEGILRIDFPRHTVLQVILYADADISPFITRFQSSKTRQDRLSQRGVDEYTEFLRQGTQGLDKLNGIPVRNFRCFVGIKSEETLSDDDLTTLQEALNGMGMAPRVLTPEALIVLLQNLFNVHKPACAPHYDPRCPLRKQVLFAETRVEDQAKNLSFGEAENRIYARCLTPKRLPPETDALDTNLLAGGIFGLMDDSKQINSPFLWSLNLIFDDQLKHDIHKKSSVMMMQRATGSFSVQVKKRTEEYVWALDQLDEYRFVRIVPSLVILGRSEHEVSVSTARARRIWEDRNYVMQEETLLRRVVFLLSLPFGLYTSQKNLTILDRDFPVPTNVAARLMPIQADFRGNEGNPVLAYVGRKGQVVGLDVFDAISNNHNFLVTASSGAGKSFNLNLLLANYYAAGAKVRAVDLGYSYEKLCRTVKGRFMDFGRDRVVINPFISSAKDEEDKAYDQITTTTVVAGMIYSSSGESLHETEWTLIKDAVRYARNTDPVNGIDAVSHYLAHFPKYASDELKDFAEVSQLIARKMAFNLVDFRANGDYGHFFNGPSTFDIQHDDFVVLELEKLKPKKELFNVVTMQVLNAITQDLYWSDRSNRRFILFEEAWSFFDAGNRIGHLIEEGYRRARKYYGSFGIVTQSYLDLQKFGDSGDVIRNNAAYKFLMESDDYREAAQKKLLNYEGLALELVESIKNNKPRYSEMFLDTPYGKGPVRLVVDPWNYWMATSAGDEVNRFMKLLHEKGDVVSVIEQLSGRVA